MHYIVMEYVEGITLKTYIEKKGQLSFKRQSALPFRWEEVLRRRIARVSSTGTLSHRILLFPQKEK